MTIHSIERRTVGFDRQVFYSFFYTTAWYSVVQQGTDRFDISEKVLLSAIIWYGFG